MLTNQKLTTLSSKVNVVKVGNKTFTISIFKQIPSRSFLLDQLLKKTQVEYIGWVIYQECFYFIYTLNDVLYKSTVVVIDQEDEKYIKECNIQIAHYRRLDDIIMVEEYETKRDSYQNQLKESQALERAYLKPEQQIYMTV